MAERLIAAVCDPAWHDEILGDLDELRARRNRAGEARARARYRLDIASVLLRSWQRHRPGVSALAIVILALTMGIVALNQRTGAADTMTFFAHDDAGAFTLELDGGRVVAATLDGRALPRERISQAGNVVRLHGADRGGDLMIRVTDTRGIEWTGRNPQ